MVTMNGSDVGEHARIEESGDYGDQLCPRVTINNLPDEALLEIFGFYMAYPLPPPSYEEDAWHTLVHVCPRWRYVVFGSPRRLNLRLLCMNRRLAKPLEIWPELPIVVHVDNGIICQLPSVTNVISVLKRHDRVCKIFIDGAPTSLLEELRTTRMSEPFPALIELDLVASFSEDEPTIPDSFLGRSVPSLRRLNLWGVRFPAIGRLLLSTRDLVTLSLGSISRSGYIAPEAMVAILSGLTRLKTLYLISIMPEPLNFGPTERVNVPLRSHASSSPLSPTLPSPVIAGIWRTSRPELMLLSTAST